MATQPILWHEIDAVVIGASAGGVDALHRVLTSLPAGFHPAVLVVLHLSADRPSGLVELLGPRCRLPVMEALDKQPVRPGSVIVAPPDYHLLVEADRTVALSLDAPVLFSRPAIDPLFESAAIVYRERLLGIVLTGSSADGSAGLAAVRRRGGLGWVQDPTTAVASTMPSAALQHAGADQILTITEICHKMAGP